MYMKILALDIATKTGWATDDASGVWDFKIGRGESNGMRVVRFKAKVKEIIQLQGIELISFERPAGRFKASIIVAAEMIGVLKLLCEEYSIEYAQYSATEIKKFATGKGNASKLLMIETAIDKYPDIELIDDNHADALHLMALTKKDLNIS